MTQFVVYDTTSGEILRYGQCDVSIVDEQAGDPGEAALNTLDVIADPETQYVVAGALTTRPRLPDLETMAGGSLTYTGGDEILLEDVPEDAIIRVYDVKFSGLAEEPDIEPTLVQEYVSASLSDATILCYEASVFRLVFSDAFPYQDEIINFEVTSASGSPIGYEIVLYRKQIPPRILMSAWRVLLWNLGEISEAEYDDWVAGVALPSKINTAITTEGSSGVPLRYLTAHALEARWLYNDDPLFIVAYAASFFWSEADLGLLMRDAYENQFPYPPYES